MIRFEIGQKETFVKAMRKLNTQFRQKHNLLV